MKQAFLWVVTWNNYVTKSVTADLIFSSPAKFEEMLGRKPDYGHPDYPDQLVTILVPDGFDDWDYIPNDY